jgi:hypothetical protein
MKHLLVMASAVALLIGSASAAPMGSMAPAPSNAQGSLDPYKQTRKQHALMAVRDEALKQQAADGGKLTEEHRAEFQRKLDAIRAGNY